METELLVQLPNRWLDAIGFEGVVGRHPFARVLKSGGVVVFCFPERSALPASVGLWLLSFFNQLGAIGPGRVRLEFETRDGLFGYLDRNGFFDLLSPRVETDPTRPLISGASVRRGLARGLVEIAPLKPGTPEGERKHIVSRLVDALVDFYPEGRSTTRLRNHAFTVLGELVDNVFVHSDTVLPGFAALQAYQKQERPRIQIGVSDSGVGIPASLRKTFGRKLARKTDADLVIDAFREGLSRHGKDSGHGCGLVQCARLAAKYGSTLVVRTPSAQIALRTAGSLRDSHEAEVLLDVGHLAGTHVSLEFRTDALGLT